MQKILVKSSLERARDASHFQLKQRPYEQTPNGGRTGPGNFGKKWDKAKSR